MPAARKMRRSQLPQKKMMMLLAMTMITMAGAMVPTTMAMAAGMT